jgi:hypothetical protein
MDLFSINRKIKFSFDPKLWNVSNIKLLIKNLHKKNGRLNRDDYVHLKEAAEWIKRAQDINNDGGFSGRYNLKSGWSSSYPETTGYIVPTLLSLFKEFENEEYLSRAKRAIDFLISLQLKEGGFPGGELHENTTIPSMFNTGQIINGLLEWYKYSKDEKVLEAAIKAGYWMVSTQEQDGSWEKYTYHNQVVTYSSHSSCWLADIGNYTGNDKFQHSALKHFDWVLKQQNVETGWFELSGFSEDDHREHKAVLHTIAYTLWGVLYMAEIFNREDGINAVEKAALNIAELQEKNKMIPGELNSKWNSISNYSCLTGNAQMALVWLKLYKLKKNKKYLNTAIKAIDSIKIIQDLKSSNPGIRGGVPGSFPIWGDYIFMAFPNWAAKFFIDALITKRYLLQ